MGPPDVAWIGASVTDAWGLVDRFPRIEVHLAYRFDKSEAVERALRDRPRVVVIKECAAYFPGPLEEYLGKLRTWIVRVRTAGARPVIATVVPVTRAHATAHPGRQEQIHEFNDRVRELAREHGCALIDLEEAISGEDRHLDPKWADADGLHLKPRAYRDRLDALVLAALG